MNDAYLIVLILMLMFYIICNSGNTSEYMTTSYKNASVDGRLYKVSSTFSDSNMAANKLASLNKFIIEYLRCLRREYIWNNSGNQQERAFVRRMIKNYDLDTLFENNPKKGEETSFVTNKGEQFGVCLRKKNENKDALHDENTLLQFVVLHELTHLGCVGYGHGAEFWSWFRWVLIQAKKYNLHSPVNYGCTGKNINYCGLDVHYNPYFGNKDTC